MSTQMTLIAEEFNEFVQAHNDAVGFIQNDRAREQALKELADYI